MCDFIELTATGLYVVTGGEPRDWTNFTWHQEVNDQAGNMEERVALELIRVELENQVGMGVRGDFTLPIGIAFGPLFAGDLTSRRVDTPPLHNSDPAVDDWQVVRADGYHTVYEYTVCGLLCRDFRTVAWNVWAVNPLMAYFQTFEEFDNRGEYFLLTSVLEGYHEPLNSYMYANGGNDPAEMLDVMTVWGVR